MTIEKIQAALFRAAEVLELRDVGLRRTMAQLHADMEPTYVEIDWSRFNQQSLAHVNRASRIQLADDGEQISIFRVELQFGVRWLLPESDGQTKDGVADVVAVIEAEIACDYEQTAEVDPEALGAFAAENAIHHAWPYWREYAAAMSVRLGMPRFTVPLRRHSTSSAKTLTPKSAKARPAKAKAARKRPTRG